MGRKHTSSNWLMGAIYGGLAVGAINPIAGVITAFACYKAHKKYEAEEIIEREEEAKQQRYEFRKRFHERQNYASYEDYLTSEAWRIKRGLVIGRANGRCESPDCKRAIAEVHHIWYPRIWGEEPISGLLGLCKEHHEAEHSPRF